ncbi:hypothetical protein F5Y11DRAFT_260832 [Daldinia sp. FL1419]|nr:hypothetical protein F5Y11DRAFT_260832 [Daldinia sp. FL1419]
MASNNRVCDRCIKKKVKCDLQRPHCSRCLEAGHSCTYSTQKRKPGPPRGSRPRTRNSSTSNRRVGIPLNHQEDDNPSTSVTCLRQYSQHETPIVSDHVSVQFIPDADQFGLNLLPYTSMAVPTLDLPSFPGYYLNSSQEKDILLRFFDDVHSAIPLFQKSRFLKSYDEGVACGDLVPTINAITTKLLGPFEFWHSEDVDLCMNSLLETTACESDSLNSRVHLNHLRQECLLAYYYFHQFPGTAAGMRISRLTRKAYTLGLNQIENPDLCSAFNHRLVTENEIEDWRYVWWCVYRLDSYSNIALGTPFMVDVESINSALIRRSLFDEVVSSSPKLYLTDDIDQLWKTSQDVVSNHCGRELNIHILTTAMLRYAGSVMTLKSARKCVDTKTAVLGGALTSVLLSLPPWYLNPKRNTLVAESDIHHCIRITNILHLHMIRLVACLPSNFHSNETQWLDCWKRSLEACQDIVSVVHEWSNQFWSRVDPALCLIVFKALWITNLHRRCDIDVGLSLVSELNYSESTLLQFLQGFSKMWTLPKVLLQLFKNSLSNDPLTYSDVNWLMNRFKMPLHPKTRPRAHPITPDSTEIPREANMPTGFTNI